MKTETQLMAIVWYVAIVWAILLLLGGVVPPLSFFKPVSTIAGVVVLSLGAFDRWFWHLSVFQSWLVNRPDIRGTWRVTLTSNWIDPVTGNPQTPIEGYFVVWETFSKLSIRLFTAESESKLRGSEILCDDDNRFDVVAIYLNEPKLEFRAKSPIHQGAFRLGVKGSPPNELVGQYWTDRNTQGWINSLDRRSEKYDSFESAREAFQAKAD